VHIPLQGRDLLLKASAGARIDDFFTGVHQADPVTSPLHLLHLFRQFLWEPLVIGVEEGDALAMGSADSSIASGGTTAVLLMFDIVDARIMEAFYYFFGIVSRAIVDNNYFKILIGLI
jgi:hypothetical protein